MESITDRFGQLIDQAKKGNDYFAHLGDYSISIRLVTQHDGVVGVHFTHGEIRTSVYFSKMNVDVDSFAFQIWSDDYNGCVTIPVDLMGVLI